MEKRRLGRRMLLGITLTIVAVQLAAQPSPLETREPGVFPVASEQVLAQRQIEPAAGELAMGEDQQVVTPLQMKIERLISERNLHKDRCCALSRQKWFTLVAGIVLGGLVTASVGGILNL